MLWRWILLDWVRSFYRRPRGTGLPLYALIKSRTYFSVILWLLMVFRFLQKILWGIELIIWSCWCRRVTVIAVNPDSLGLKSLPKYKLYAYIIHNVLWTFIYIVPGSSIHLLPFCLPSSLSGSVNLVILPKIASESLNPLILAKILDKTCIFCNINFQLGFLYSLL